MLEIETWRDPHDTGCAITRPKKISLEPGLTILTGCNGAGKTTLLRNIKHACSHAGIPFAFYDNLSNGGGNAIEKAMYDQEYQLMTWLFSSSEGESIKLNFGNMAAKIKGFLSSGFYDSKENRLARIFQKDKEPITDNRRVLLFDALDSGLSVDSVAEIREVFDMILADAEKLGMEVYIVAAANEYEMARNAPCFDPATGKYVDIPDYEAFRTFILKSRERKEKRIVATIRKQERQAEKEKSQR